MAARRCAADEGIGLDWKSDDGDISKPKLQDLKLDVRGGAQSCKVPGLPPRDSLPREPRHPGASSRINRWWS